MSTKKTTKSAARFFLEEVTGGPLTLADLLHAIRMGEEMSQAEFALRLGVSKSHICDIEKGRKSVSPMRAMEFARILKYSEHQFVRLALQDIVNQLHSLKSAHPLKRNAETSGLKPYWRKFLPRPGLPYKKIPISCSSIAKSF